MRDIPLRAWSTFHEQDGAHTRLLLALNGSRRTVTTKASIPKGFGSTVFIFLEGALLYSAALHGASGSGWTTDCLGHFQIRRFSSTAN